MTIATLNENAVDAIQDLIRINIDSANGFQTAAEQIENTRIAELFARLSGERQSFAQRLRTFIALTDEQAEDSGSIKGKLHRWWIDIVGTVKDGDEHAILAEAERGEDKIKALYEQSVDVLAGTPAESVVRDQLKMVIDGHDLIRDMRDARKSD